MPAIVRHTLNLESGLNDGLALPFVLFFLVLAQPGGDAGGEAAKVLGRGRIRRRRGRGGRALLGGRLHHHLPGGGITRRYEGIYAIGFGLAAFGLADVTIGNGLIAAFVAGIAMGAVGSRDPGHVHRVRRERQRDLQVITFFIFGALIVATGYHGEIWRLAIFVILALLVARPRRDPALADPQPFTRPAEAFIAWFGPKGVASMLFALFVLKSAVEEGELRSSKSPRSRSCARSSPTA